MRQRLILTLCLCLCTMLSAMAQFPTTPYGIDAYGNPVDANGNPLVTITEIACALILGIIANLMLRSKDKNS